jgi:VWFA-related protein
MRIARVAVITACVLGVTGAASPQQPVFRGTADTIRVFVTVTDRDGRLVTTLTQDAFEVRDEGRQQPITVFDNSPQPIRLVVMLDVSGSMEGNLPLLRAAAEQLFARLLPDDLVRVGSFGHEVTIASSFTRDLITLRNALPDAIASDAPTPLWRALNEAIQAFDPGADERRVVLVLSDGKDSGPIDFRQRPVSQGEVIDRARALDVMVYAIGMRSRSRQPIQPGIGPGALRGMLVDGLPDPGLARVAEETGGGYAEIRFGQDLGAAFAGVADELHRQYLIGFAPPRRDGKVHEIDVRVNDRGLRPRARQSYVAPSQPARGSGPDAP